MKKKNIITAAAIAAATTGTIGIIQYTDAISIQYKTTTTLNIRSGPGTYFKVVGKIAQGKTINIISIDKYGWAKLDNGKYVSSMYLSKVNTLQNNNNVNSTVHKYAKSNLNLRKGPGTNYYKITMINKGDKVKVIETNGSWTKVKYNGYTGYCSTSYLSDLKQSINTNTVSVQTINKIKVDSNKCIMYCYSNNKLIKTLPCSVGKYSTPTPKGTFTIFYKQINRPYYKLNIPGGASNNPLGNRWMQFYGNAYAIHGNSNESTIGGHVSEGCIRLHNWDAQWLYDRVLTNQCTVTIY